MVIRCVQLLASYAGARVLKKCCHKVSVICIPEYTARDIWSLTVIDAMFMWNKKCGIRAKIDKNIYYKVFLNYYVIFKSKFFFVYIVRTNCWLDAFAYLCTKLFV